MALRTTVDIDESLLDRAMQSGGFRTKSEAIAAALEEYVARRERASLLDLIGTIEFDRDHLAKLDDLAAEDPT